MYAYEKFHNGVMTDYIPSDDEINNALKNIPVME